MSSAGRLLADVAPLTYKSVHAWSWSSLYYLFEPNVALSEDTIIEFHAAEMPTGQISIGLSDFTRMWFIPWLEDTPVAPVFEVMVNYSKPTRRERIGIMRLSWPIVRSPLPVEPRQISKLEGTSLPQPHRINLNTRLAKRLPSLTCLPIVLATGWKEFRRGALRPGRLQSRTRSRFLLRRNMRER
ncbi:hypothetical protein M1O19_03250 [Dehalococcoidia bacterium]|nr:hypothetical protein [Dehalococcoidia bacterium]